MLLELNFQFKLLKKGATHTHTHTGYKDTFLYEYTKEGQQQVDTYSNQIYSKLNLFTKTKDNRNLNKKGSLIYHGK